MSWKQTNTKVGGDDCLVHCGELRGKVEGIRQEKLEFHLFIDSWTWIIMSYSVWGGQNTEEKLRKCAPSWMAAEGRAVVTVSQRLLHPKTIVPLQSMCQAKKGGGGGLEKAARPGILTSTIFNHPCTQTYAIPFNFLSAMIVNEKQYCNTSNYNRILVPQDPLKRKKYIFMAARGHSSLHFTASHKLSGSWKAGTLPPSSCSSNVHYQVFMGRFIIS